MSEEGDLILLMSRRGLLKNMGTAFLTCAIAKTGVSFEAKSLELDLTRVVMGSASRITLVGEDKENLRSAAEAAYKEMKRLEGLMTVYNQDSEISRLNRLGWSKISQESIELLWRSRFFSDETNGAFDITLGSYMDLVIAGSYAGFNKPGMRVDFGGIGVGYAVDRAASILRSRGVKRALIDGGGEIKALGSKSDNLSWRVGIRNPFQKKEFIDVIGLENLSVSTSGNYEGAHIIDPRTGRFPTGLESATIVSEDAVRADALSTAVFVLGEHEGLDLIEKTPGVEGLLLTSKGRVVRSSGFDSYVI
jgi:thiamine biosynthesis lipoprotein